MVASPTGLGPENDCAGEDQQQLHTTDPSSRQRERPTSTNPQMSDSNKKPGGKPQKGALLQERLTVGRNIRLRLSLASCERVGQCGREHGS
jgi:hypothetical protein